MIFLAIILIIVSITKLCLMGSDVKEIDYTSLPISKEQLEQIAKYITILEALVGIMCGLYIIFV